MDIRTERPPVQIVRLDANATVELDGPYDEDNGLYLAINDEDTLVLIELPQTADAWLVAARVARKILALEPEIRAKTIGYTPPSSPPAAYAPEHNAHTGPGAFRPIPRPLGPLMVQQDPFGGPSSGAQ